MKLKITLLIFLLTSIASFSQNGINYKALIKDDLGNVVVNQDIDVRFTLEYDGGEFGIVTLYEELHTVTTDANGIIVLVMGSGTVISGVFPTNSWIYTTYLITEIDIEQDGTFIDFGITQFEYAPKAIQARRADVARTANYVTSTSSGSSAISSNSMGVGTRTTNFGQTAVGFYNAVDNDLLFAVGNGTSDTDRNNALVVMENGNVGIGVPDPNHPLHMLGRFQYGSGEYILDVGSFRTGIDGALQPIVDAADNLGQSTNRWSSVYATNGTINTSDRRDKTNIKYLDYGLKEIMKLNPVTFNWKNKLNEDTKIGLIAQELLDVVPEVVKTHETVYRNEDRSVTERVEMNRLGVYYSDLIPVLIKGIQELKQENDKLKKRIEALENN